jgi:hypothetical protein
LYRDWRITSRGIRVPEQACRSQRAHGWPTAAPPPRIGGRFLTAPLGFTGEEAARARIRDRRQAQRALGCPRERLMTRQLAPRGCQLTLQNREAPVWADGAAFRPWRARRHQALHGPLLPRVITR